MSTNCKIGIITTNEEVKSIYCHSDGYPSWTGNLLMKHYNTQEKAEALIALGGISQLNEKIKPDKEFTIPEHNSYRLPAEPSRHTFDTPHPNVIKAYHRDRGEELEIIKHRSEALFYRKDKSIPYKYLFKNGKWHVNGQELIQDVVKQK